MGVPEIKEFGSEMTVSNGRWEYRCCIVGSHLLIGQRKVSLEYDVDCFYAFPAGRNDFDVKVFYKNCKVESLGRTRSHEGAKKWVEKSNKLLNMVA